LSLKFQPFRVCSETNPAMPSTTPAETSKCDEDVGSNSDETDAKSDEGKTVMHFDSKDLILQFTKLNVTTESTKQATSQQKRHISSPTSSNVTTIKVNKNWRFKAKSDSLQRPFVLRPSKLSSLARKDRGEALFREFSVECSKELDSIATASPHTTSSSTSHFNSKRHTTSGKKKCGDVLLSPMTSHHNHHACQKRRKASSCAEQARQLSQDELDETIDILADFLEESVVFPKKMSYMAELMYTWLSSMVASYQLNSLRCTFLSKCVNLFSVFFSVDHF